ncbi:enoyl-CoA hydratase [Pelagibacteraceae bacterium]|nr:enoyl-CoA hydratase [Pelagibacteraceae bacterium]
MNFNLLKIEETNNIYNIILSDPKKQNTLSEEMINELQTAVKNGETNKKINVILISSTGKVFSAGHNLKDLNSKRDEKDKGKEYYKRIFKLCSELMINIKNCSKPIIAVVDGIATAAGCQLISSCDLAYSSNRSQYATPGVNIGLFCSTPMVPLSRNVAKKHAMEMLLTGDLINAEKAKSIGLINDIFEPEKLNNKVIEIASKIASKSKTTIKIGKRAFYEQKEMSLEDAYNYTSKIMAENMLHQDSEEGISAFLEKRIPNWKE